MGFIGVGGYRGDVKIDPARQDRLIGKIDSSRKPRDSVEMVLMKAP